MRRLWNILACLILLMSGTACEKEIEFDGDELASRLTVSAIADAGTPLKINVASSVFFLNSSKFQESAYTGNLDTERGRVRVFVNDGKVAWETRLIPDEGRYSLCYGCDYVPAPGDRIRIEAEFPGYDAVTAETDVLPLPRFEVVSVSLDNHEMTIRIDDDAAFEKNYFLHLLTRQENPDGTLFEMEMPVTSGDVLFRDVASQLSVSGFDTFMESSEWVNYYLFHDTLIRGKSYSFKIKWGGDADRLCLELKTVTDSFFWYVTSLETLRNSTGGLFGEGVSIYSNVKGGYGVVCASSSVSVAVEL